MEKTLDADRLSGWIGRSQVSEDTLDPRQARLLQVTLDEEATLEPDDALPAMWHYVYFNPELRASALQEDGHEALGGFLPPVALPRRMWAGGEIRIGAPLRIGERVTKTSTIRDVQMKQGRSGPLCFVTVEHGFAVSGAHRFTETQTIVYRDAKGGGGTGATIPCGTARRSRIIHPDPVLLFRYSALIFYGHRIHFDADYTRSVEGYPGLVVHGPLTATLLIGFAAQGRGTPNTITIRAQAPLFSGAPFTLEATDDASRTEAWARSPDGGRAMTVTLEFDKEATP